MRIADFEEESIADGPGLRYVIFAQGCIHQCPNCHNPTTWDINGGKEYSVKELIRKLNKLKKEMKAIRGVTFSGGDPFLQAADFAEVAMAVKKIGWDVVTYTGYTYEELINTDSFGVQALLSATDILVDGRFVQALYSGNLRFRGSSNQRVIDAAKTLEKGQIVIWKDRKNKTGRYV
ncbi:MAG: anaerobic ribonucleoside-triphosphate reductase activating protein [Treponema sp.]|jgi:anaerobic ribonucleoside-triphosphate reductase activating protein|nr:anaerobic ribonucleoside-triphosphate reductase activating protein [Treponema sp.]